MNHLRYTVHRTWFEIRRNYPRCSMGLQPEHFVTAEAARNFALAWIRETSLDELVIEPMATVERQRLRKASRGRRDDPDVLEPFGLAELVWTIGVDGMVRNDGKNGVKVELPPLAASFDLNT